MIGRFGELVITSSGYTGIILKEYKDKKGNDCVVVKCEDDKIRRYKVKNLIVGGR